MGLVPVALDLPGKSRRIRVEPLRAPTSPKEPMPERAPAPEPPPVKEPAQPSRSSSSAASVSKPLASSTSSARS
jgi:hypothetical protein